LLLPANYLDNRCTLIDLSGSPEPDFFHASRQPAIISLSHRRLAAKVSVNHYLKIRLFFSKKANKSYFHIDFLLVFN